MFDTLVELVTAGGNAQQMQEVLALFDASDTDQSLTPAVVAWRARLRGHLARADGQDAAAAEAHWRQAVAYERWGAHLMARRTEEELARLLLDHGRIEEATVLLNGVRETYERIGASTWLADLPTAVPGR